MRRCKKTFVATVAWAAMTGLAATGAQAQPAPAAPAQAQASVIPAGDYDGILDIGALGKLRLVLHVGGPGDGGDWLASPDQGPQRIPVSAFERRGDKVTFAVPAIAGTFDGLASADGSTLTGAWQQSGRSMPLVLKRRAPDVAAPVPASLPARPQLPQRPFPYREIEVAFDNPAGPSHLAGTLTVPAGRGPFPAAVLVTGSGAQDRDETLLGHKPFLVLADHLSRRGIAVLRVDDRGVGGSTGDVARATSADFATDVDAALAFLRRQSDIDRHKIGIVGHSEGGMIGALVAARNPAAAWLVMLAGPGIKGDELLLAQQRLILAAAGVAEDELDRQDAAARRLMAAIKDAPDEAAARTRAEAALAGTQLAIAAPGEQVAELVSSNWYRYLLNYDPAPVLRGIKVPVLALNGSLDLQVPPKENLAAIRAALSANPDAEIAELPGLNHLFQTAQTGAPAEYYRIEETFAPAALDRIAGWIKRRVR